MTSVLQMIVLLVVILFATFYLVLPKKEGFVNLSGVTSSSLYMNAGRNATTQDIDSNFTAVETTLADKGSLLHMRRCYQFPQETLESFRNKFKYEMNGDGMYYVDFDMVTCKFSDVESRIVCELQKFKEKICGTPGKTLCGKPRSNTPWIAKSGCSSTTPSPMISITPQSTSENECKMKIQGPVYAFVFQAPYYRTKDTITNEERPLALQFQTLDTMLMPYNGVETDIDSETPLFIYVQLLFPRYNKNGTFTSVNFMDQYYIPEWDRKYFSKEMQCFIKTIKKYDMVGGCATTNAPYEAKCLGPKTAMGFSKADEKNTLSTYGILYQVNNKYTMFNELFETDFTKLSPPMQPQEVFHVKGNFTNIGDAVAACNKAGGAVVASREDVYDAYAAGLNVCERGIINDGLVAFSSQGNMSDCPEMGKFSIEYQQNRKNIGAFCYGERPFNDPNVSKWDARGFLSKLDWVKAPTNKVNTKCGTFSDDKYFEKYPDAKQSGLSGLQHWVTTGIAQGLKGFIKESDKSGDFDEQTYTTLSTGKNKSLAAMQYLKEQAFAEENRVCIK